MKGRKPTWNAARGRLLYDAGLPIGEIAGRLGVDRRAVSQYARNHSWPIREKMALKGPHQPVHLAAPVKPRVVKRGASTLPPLASLTD